MHVCVENNKILAVVFFLAVRGGDPDRIAELIVERCVTTHLNCLTIMMAAKQSSKKEIALAFFDKVGDVRWNANCVISKEPRNQDLAGQICTVTFCNFTLMLLMQ